MPMHAQRLYDPGDVITMAQDKIVVLVVARGDILTAARAKEILGATAESAASRSTNNAYNCTHENENEN